MNGKMMIGGADIRATLERVNGLVASQRIDPTDLPLLGQVAQKKLAEIVRTDNPRSCRNRIDSLIAELIILSAVAHQKSEVRS